MNFYFKNILAILCVIFSYSVGALDLQGVYSTSCTRDIGVILAVDRSKIYLLNLEGRIKSLPRYEIVGIASYPINHIPITSIKIPSALSSLIKFYKIKSEYKKTLVELVEGWPIGFSKDKISFLDKNGREVAVQRNNIWSIETSPTRQSRDFDNQILYQYDFLHPTSMFNCDKKSHGKMSGDAKVIKIVPQEFISDSVTIKRKFDVIQKEHEVIKMYDRSQKFYPVPEVYKNIVTLGFWGAFGSRYAASKNRTNNGAPILIEELSTGPFGYQHIFLTGAAPNKLFIHEEPQTQIFYRFKADYFHMSLFFDPNKVLVGDKFAWQDDDISKGEFRLVESTFVETGLDFGNFSLILIPLSRTELGLKMKDSDTNLFELDSFEISLPRYGLAYHNPFLKADIVYGSRREALGGGWLPTRYVEEYDYFEYEFFPAVDHQFNVLRVNAEYDLYNKTKLSGSYIQRTLETSVFRSKSLTGAVYLDYQINYKYLVRGLFSIERVSSTQADVSFYLKFGLNFNIIF